MVTEYIRPTDDCDTAVLDTGATPRQIKLEVKFTKNLWRNFDPWRISQKLSLSKNWKKKKDFYLSPGWKSFQNFVSKKDLKQSSFDVKLRGK